MIPRSVSGISESCQTQRWTSICSTNSRLPSKMSKQWSELTPWSFLKMIPTNSTLDQKTTIFTRLTCICQTPKSSRNGGPFLAIAPQWPKFQCILENLRLIPAETSGFWVIWMSWCSLPRWTGPSNCGTLKMRWSLILSWHSSPHRNTFTMFNGRLFTQLFSLLLTEMVTLISGTSAKTLRAQSPERRHLRLLTQELTRTSMTLRLCLAWNGLKMEGRSLSETLMVTSLSGIATKRFTCPNSQTLTSSRTCWRATLLMPTREQLSDLKYLKHLKQ